MADIMIDLETLDTTPTSVILSIGACRIEWEKEEIVDPFYRVVDVQSCLAAGLTESWSTKEWWSRQSEEARRVFTDPSVSLLQALADFATYLKIFGARDVRVWGNGSDFDNVILTNAYNALDLDAPWRFYNNRCFRTMKASFKDHIIEPVREGTYHNALDDAKHQAGILLQLKEVLNCGRLRTHRNEV